jgi:hypothetical protein
VPSLADSREMVELLLKTYLGWLRSPEARKLKDKLAKPETRT